MSTFIWTLEGLAILAYVAKCWRDERAYQRAARARREQIQAQLDRYAARGRRGERPIACTSRRHRSRS